MVIFTADKKYMAGPFTDFDNKTNGQLWSPIIPSDDVLIQVVLLSESIDEFQLSIGKINHGFISSQQKSISQSCHLDVLCGTADGFPDVDKYRDAIRSVGLYSIEGTRICTGALINNTKNDCTPYFLTADHCGITDNNSTSVVVHWKYENQTCRQPESVESGSTGDGILDITNTGVKIVATYPNSDMSLLELDNEVPAEAEPYFAGWNISSTPPSKSVTIHHPNADEKRISIDNDPLTVYTDEENFWYVDNWEIGSTEGGSSGAPIFNSDQEIIGQIFGGEASCGNGLWDIFGRLDVSWEGDGTTKRSLKSWLDPEQSGISHLNGRSCTALLGVNEKVVSICNLSNTEYSLILNANEGFSGFADLSHEIDAEGISVSFANQQIGPDGSTVANITVDFSTPQGKYELKLVASEGANEAITFVTLLISNTVPSKVNKISPDDAATVGTQLTFEWEDDHDSYEIEISKNSNFSSPVFTAADIVDNFVMVTNIDSETDYYWRVRGTNACSIGEWNDFTFETGKIECTVYTALDLPKIITEDDRNTVISTINVPSNQAISDVNVISIKGTHSWVGDLQMRLESPSGREIILINQECERDRDFHIGFDDSATTTFVCPLSDSMTHIPDAPLSIFIDELSGGEWKLKVLDLEEFDGGSFDSWSIEVCANVSKNSVSTEDLVESVIRTYPNPTGDVLYIDQRETINNGSYTIYDAVGATRQIGNLEPSLDVHNLQNGIYFLQIREGAKILGTKKIIISK